VDVRNERRLAFNIFPPSQGGWKEDFKLGYGGFGILTFELILLSYPERGYEKPMGR
jgi:hypothetical protein